MTPEEKYWAEKKAADDAARARQEEEQRRQNSNSGFFDFLKNLFSLDFGNIIMWGLLLAGAYFLAKTEWGQELLDKGIDLLPEDWQLNVRGMLNKVGIDVDMHNALNAATEKDFPGLKKKLIEQADIPPPVIEIIAQNKDTFKDFLKTVSDANTTKDTDGKDIKGKVSGATIMNANSLYALITQKSDMMQKIATTVMKDEKASKGETASQIYTSLREIVNNDQRLAALMGEHFEKTKALFTTAGVAPEHITKLKETYGKDPKAAQRLLGQLLTPDATGKLPDPKTIITSAIANDPAIRTALGVDAQAATLLASAEGQALVTKLGTEKLAQLVPIAVSNPAAAFKFMLQPENRDAMPELLAFAAKNPDTVKLPVDAAALRTLILAGIKDSKPTPALTALYDEIAKTGELSLAKLQGPLIAHVLTSDPKQADTTATAIKTLAAGIDQTKMTAAEKTQLAELNQLLTPATLSAMIHIQTNTGNALGLRDKYIPENDKGERIFSGAHLTTLLLNKDNRNELRQAGIEHITTIAQQTAPQTGAKMNARNLNAMLTFVDRIGEINSTAKDPQAATRASDIVLALTNFIENGGTNPFGNNSPTAIAAFFRHQDGANAKAVGELLHNLNMTSLDPKQRQIAEALRDTWGTTKGGIAQVFTSESAIQTLLASANSAQPQTCGASEEPAIGPIEALFAPAAINANASEINTLARVLARANCVPGVAPTTMADARPFVPAGPGHTQTAAL